jgi:hypothetical protein
MVGRHWDTVEGRVVATEVAVETAAGYEDRLRYLVDIQPPGGSTVRVKLEEPKFIRGGFAQPSVGAAISVLFDPKSQKAKFDTSDPRINLSRQPDAGQAAFEAAAAASPGTPPPVVNELQALGVSAAGEISGAPGSVGRSGSATGNQDDPAARLAKLEDLKKKGLVTDAEYAAQRQRIIDAV